MGITEINQMAKSPNELRAEELTKARLVSGTLSELEKLQINVQIEAAEAQKRAAKATEKNAHYMLASVIIATIATIVTTAGAVFNILNLPDAPH